MFNWSHISEEMISRTVRAFSLAARRHRNRGPERAHDDVDDSRRGLDVAGSDRCGRPRIHEATFGSADAHRSERAAGRRQVRVDECADHEVAGGARDGERAVEVAVLLGRRAREVDGDRLTGHRDGCANLDVAFGGLEHVRCLVRSVGQHGDAGAHATFGIDEELVHRRRNRIPPASRAELGNALLRETVRRQLRAEIAAPLSRVAHPLDE